jgi:hypothetical protein
VPNSSRHRPHSRVSRQLAEDTRVNAHRKGVHSNFAISHPIAVDVTIKSFQVQKRGDEMAQIGESMEADEIRAEQAVKYLAAPRQDSEQRPLNRGLATGGIDATTRCNEQQAKRQYEHIKESAKKRGRSTKRAKEIAARTVNKQRRQSGQAKSTTRSGGKRRTSRGKGGSKKR